MLWHHITVVGTLSGVSSSTALSSKDSDAMAAASGTSTFWTNGQYNLAHLANANLDMMMSDSAVSHDVMPVMAPMNAMASNMVIGAVSMVQVKLMTFNNVFASVDRS